MKEKVRLVIAGGGTGGHVFPGLAILEALKDLCYLETMWIGTGRKIEKDILADRGLEYEVLDVRPIKGKGPLGLLSSIFQLPLSILRASRLLGRFMPDMVLGVGGYVSGPVLLAAKMRGIPTAIHEQNSIPGLANRLCSRFVDRIFLSFPDDGNFFDRSKSECLGNPVRKEILALAADDGDRGSRGSDTEEPMKILIIGGSQGASSMNRLVSSALKILKQSGMCFKAIHQTGPVDRKRFEHFYSAFEMDVEVRDFIEDIGIAYMWADLIICRAGASTLSELTVLGKPAICIPYPHAADGHQEVNARSLCSHGAAICLDERETGAVTLVSHLEELMLDRGRLHEMASKAKALGKPDAATDIAQSLLAMCRKGMTTDVEVKNSTSGG